MVAGATLSGYSGRLNQEVRVKRGLSYGAGAQVFARRRGGQLVASTLVDHTKAVEAAQVILTTLSSVKESPARDAELVARKASLIGAFSRAIDSNDGLLGSLADYALYGIALDELERYTSRVEAITPDDIAATCAFLCSDEASFITGQVVGVNGGMVL